MGSSRSFRMRISVPLVVFAICAAPSLASAFRIDIHAAITREAAAAESIPACAVKYLEVKATVPDITQTTLEGGKLRPNDSYDSSNHFDREPGASNAMAFKAGANHVQGTMNEAIAKIQAGDCEAALCAVAYGLHAIQDLCAHSNFSELTAADQAATKTALWANPPGDPPGTLTLAHYDKNAPDPGRPNGDGEDHDAMAKDSPSGPQGATKFNAARAAAVSLSRDYLSRLKARMTADQWDALSKWWTVTFAIWWELFDHYIYRWVKFFQAGEQVVDDVLEGHGARLVVPHDAFALPETLAVLSPPVSIFKTNTLAEAPNGDLPRVLLDVRTRQQQIPAGKALQAHLSFDAGDVSDLMPGSLKIYYWHHYTADSAVWEAVPGAIVNEAGNYADFSIAQTGLYAVSGTVGNAALEAAQSTFVDGTMLGTNCTSLPCWPGIRGTQLGQPIGLTDNVNTAAGDSVILLLPSNLRPRGMGINWQYGFDRAVGGGLSVAHTNGSYTPAYDSPRMIYRLFDPATKSWSPFDSSALYADWVSIGAIDTTLGNGATRTMTGQDTTVVNSAFRTDWPPLDKLGQSLPGGFTVNGMGNYGQLAFLPRGTRLQYYFKSVDIQGGTHYFFRLTDAQLELRDLPTLPGSSIVAPDINEFDVLPGIYPPGSVGSLLAGQTRTPVLLIDAGYGTWGSHRDPISEALIGMGVRADRYRLLQDRIVGNGIGGRSTSWSDSDAVGNYFPSASEYGIADSLAAWYRIVLIASHVRGVGPTLSDADAALLHDWWTRDTGINGGDRCLFGAGNEFFTGLLDTIPDRPDPNAAQLAGDAYGVAGIQPTWGGLGATPYPAIDDQFASPNSGPGLGPPGGYSYTLDGAWAGPQKPDALLRTSSPDAFTSALYPNSPDIAGVGVSSERDLISDSDRSKGLGYGYSMDFLHNGATKGPGSVYLPSGLQNRIQVLYKFLTGCRGLRVSPGPACWPCPTPMNPIANWLAGSFQTTMYGPLYPIQDPLLASGVADWPMTELPFSNRLLVPRPNPANPGTTILYSTGRAGRVSMRIYDARGRLVRDLVDRIVPAGQYTVYWDGTDRQKHFAASGVYFVQVEYPDRSKDSRKVTLLK